MLLLICVSIGVGGDAVNNGTACIVAMSTDDVHRGGVYIRRQFEAFDHTLVVRSIVQRGPVLCTSIGLRCVAL